MAGSQAEEKTFVLNNRDELALAYLRRADESTTVLRSAPFAACTTAIAFIFAELPLAVHVPSLVIFALAAATILELGLAEDKAIERFKAGCGTLPATQQR